MLGIAITVATAGKALSIGGVQGLLLASGSGAVAGAVATGSLRGAVTGALSAAAFYGIGSAFEAANCSGCFKAGKLKDTAKAVKTALHATTGGLMNVLNGGRFGHGFVSAGITQSFADPITSHFSTFPGQVTAAAVVGGTASEITGGKFANGAVTGAFSYAFAEAARRNGPQGRCRNCVDIPESDRSALQQIFGESVDGVEVRENSWFARLHRALATTRRERIYLSISGQDFLSDPNLMLHEYYHVVEQWRTGELTVPRYLWENATNGNGYWGNSYEVDARQFARENVWRFESLRRGP